MVFPRRKKNDDIADIKEAMNDDTEMPVASDFNLEPVIEHKEPAISAPLQTGGAPLFVKVDRYKDLMASIHEMKVLVSGVKQVFTLFNEIETVRADALKVLRATTQRLEKSLFEFDNIMIKPRDLPGPPQDLETVEPTSVDDSLIDLQKQLNTLKRDLENVQ